MDSAATTRRDTLISKKLSKLLRHKAHEEGIPIDDAGLVNVKDILAYRDIKSLKATLEDIKRIVDENNKKRFKLIQRDDEFFISALQGHSISSIQQTFEMIELDPKIDEHWPTYICHGTFRNKLHLIKSAGGLSKMDRNHIHFSNSIPSDFIKYIPECTSYSNEKVAISGIRTNANVLLFLNIDKIRNGSKLKFLKSSNDVILSPGDDKGIIDIKYIDKIIDKDMGLLSWSDI